MNQQTPSEYLHNKNVRENSLFRIIGGKGFYVMKGELIPAEEIEKLFPYARAVRQKSEFKRENIDSSRAWMD